MSYHFVPNAERSAGGNIFGCTSANFENSGYQYQNCSWFKINGDNFEGRTESIEGASFPGLYCNVEGEYKINIITNFNSDRYESTEPILCIMDKTSIKNGGAPILIENGNTYHIDENCMILSEVTGTAIGDTCAYSGTIVLSFEKVG